jgi:hypothetical protein
MDDATRAVRPPDPEMIQVGYAVRQGRIMAGQGLRDKLQVVDRPM